MFPPLRLRQVFLFLLHVIFLRTLLPPIIREVLLVIIFRILGRTLLLQQTNTAARYFWRGRTTAEVEGVVGVYIFAGVNPLRVDVDGFGEVC